MPNSATYNLIWLIIKSIPGRDAEASGKSNFVVL